MTVQIDFLEKKEEAPALNRLQIIADLEDLLSIRATTYSSLTNRNPDYWQNCKLCYQSLRDAIEMLKGEECKMARQDIILYMKSQADKYSTQGFTAKVELFENALSLLKIIKQ